MPTVTQQKCACEPCVCIVDIADAINKDGKNYCSDECANGHPNSSGCDHAGCACKA
ncbi:MAG: metallothionein [Sphingomonadales bacterium]